MAGAIAAKAPISIASKKVVATQSALGRRVLIAITIVFLSIFVLVPLANVFNQAFSKGIDGYFAVFFPHRRRTARP